MIVPYGSTAMNHWWKNAFDAGDVGLGKMANPLELGCECLGEIVYLDAVAVDEDGAAGALPQAICLHEEDYGVLWMHRDAANQAAETRRSRRMVVSSIATVGNYEYGFFWYFYLDGTIQAEVKLTGIIQTQAVAAGNPGQLRQPGDPGAGRPPSPAPVQLPPGHVPGRPGQLGLRGGRGARPGRPANPYGNAFTVQETLLETESAAQRMAAPERSRSWKIVNHGARNACGEPVGYNLVPTHASAPLLAQPTAAITSRAAFATRHLWVTPARDDELRAAGEFPNQHPGGAGLPAWTAADRPVTDTGIALWHTVGRDSFLPAGGLPGDAGGVHRFHAAPAGFFDRNPALDLAPPARPPCP